MDKLIPDGYVLKEIEYKTNEPDNVDEMIKHLNGILLDRSIPEENKQMVRKQFDELMRIKQITMQPPRIILEKSEE